MKKLTPPRGVRGEERAEIRARTRTRPWAWAALAILVGVGSYDLLLRWIRSPWAGVAEAQIRQDSRVVRTLGKVSTVGRPVLVESIDADRLRARFSVTGSRGTSDLDFWMERKQGAWAVVQYRIPAPEGRTSGTYRGGYLVDTED